MTSIVELSVIVPAYQEAANIQQVLKRLVDVLEKQHKKFEIILVADGCTDGTAEIARQLCSPMVQVVDYFPNRGKGYALRQGFLKSTAELVVFCDGDLDIHPNSIPTLIDILELQHADVVVASKSHPNSEVDYPQIRRFQSYIFGLLVRFAFDLPVRDTQTGLKVFKRSALNEHLKEVVVNGFAFDLELLARIAPRYKVIEGPVQIDFNFDSRIRMLEPLRMIYDMFCIKSRIKKSKKNEV